MALVSEWILNIGLNDFFWQTRNMETLTLRPSKIRFSQGSIGCRFSNGTPLTCVFAHPISGSLKVTDLPGIEVLSMNGHWWTVTGNRRLFLYRKLEEVGVVETISVQKSWMCPTSDLFKRKFTNVCGGKKVSCRQKFLQSSLNEIVSEWKNGQDVVAKWDQFKQVWAAPFGYREVTDHDAYEECQRYLDCNQSEYGLYDSDEDDDYCEEQYDYGDPEGQDDYYKDADENQYQDVHYDEYDHVDTYNDQVHAYNDHIDACNAHIDYHDRIVACDDHEDAVDDHMDAYNDQIGALNDQINAYYDQIDAGKDHMYAYNGLDQYYDHLDEYYNHLDAYDDPYYFYLDDYYYDGYSDYAESSDYGESVDYEAYRDYYEDYYGREWC